MDQNYNMEVKRVILPDGMETYVVSVDDQYLLDRNGVEWFPSSVLESSPADDLSPEAKQHLLDMGRKHEMYKEASEKYKHIKADSEALEKKLKKDSQKRLRQIKEKNPPGPDGWKEVGRMLKTSLLRMGNSLQTQMETMRLKRTYDSALDDYKLRVKSLEESERKSAEAASKLIGEDRMSNIGFARRFRENLPQTLQKQFAKEGYTITADRDNNSVSVVSEKPNKKAYHIDLDPRQKFSAEYAVDLASQFASKMAREQREDGTRRTYFDSGRQWLDMTLCKISLENKSEMVAVSVGDKYFFDADGKEWKPSQVVASTPLGYRDVPADVRRTMIDSAKKHEARKESELNKIFYQRDRDRDKALRDLNEKLRQSQNQLFKGIYDPSSVVVPENFTFGPKDQTPKDQTDQPSKTPQKDSSPRSPQKDQPSKETQKGAPKRQEPQKETQRGTKTSKEDEKGKYKSDRSSSERREKYSKNSREKDARTQHGRNAGEQAPGEKTQKEKTQREKTPEPKEQTQKTEVDFFSDNPEAMEFDDAMWQQMMELYDDER